MLVSNQNIDNLIKTQLDEFLLNKKIYKRNNQLNWLTNLNLYELSVNNLKQIIDRYLLKLENKNIIKINEIEIGINNNSYNNNNNYNRTSLFSVYVFFNNEFRKAEIIQILKHYIPNKLNYYISNLYFIKI